MRSAAEVALLPAAGSIGGDPISSRVDSEIARYFLEDYLSGRRNNPTLDSKIESILARTKEESITNERMREIAAETSVDFAAMVFAHVQTQRNLEIKKSFLFEYARVKEGNLNLADASSHYKIALVPGLFYKSKPETKGDLREVRATLESAGLEVESIPIREAGTVEENGRIIAEFIKNERTNKQLILISTSKGGPDTHYALGALNPKDAMKVSIWFSVGGALHGSPHADHWTQWPRRWIASVIGLFVGFSASMVESLSTQRSLSRVNQIQMPPNVDVIHFVGVPLSGTVIREVKQAYNALKRFGPNDGITLLSDEILSDSAVITALGLDHWYRDPDLKRKILALVAAVTKRQANPSMAQKNRVATA